MSSEISYREYWEQVRSLAQDAADEHGYSDGSDCGTQAGEWIWETCDGHQWVIYTAYAFDVLRHSENDGYSVENFGDESVVDDSGIKWAALVFGALYADVMEAYQRLEAPDEDEE